MQDNKDQDCPDALAKKWFIFTIVGLSLYSLAVILFVL